MREYHVLNFGAGVQSSALYLLACEGKLQIDVAIFADTQDEPEAVYQHLERLRSLGKPEIWVRSVGSLGDNLIQGRNATGQRFVSIPAFTKDANGKIGMVRRQCTREFKIDVVNRTIRRELLGLKPRQQIPKDVLIRQYFGISTDEAARAERAKRHFEQVRHTIPVYPLLELGWSRNDCVAYLRKKLPTPVPKSSCVFCPYRTNQSWLHLKQTDVAGWNRAVEIDTAMRDKNSIVTRGFRQQMFLHRSCIPLKDIDFHALQPNTLDPMTTSECHGICGV
jgi:hypothetical protein